VKALSMRGIAKSVRGALHERLSREVGGPILEVGCGTGRIALPLALGGNAPFVVFDDADIELAVESLPLRRQGCDRLEILKCQP